MEVELVYVAHEIELDYEYEYDAAQYFDFTREETPAEAREAECWFESAKSYPPSRESYSGCSVLYLQKFCLFLWNFCFGTEIIEIFWLLFDLFWHNDLGRNH